MADKPPGKSAVSSRDPRLVYRPIGTGTTTPPNAGGTPLVPAGVLSPERGERGPRQVGGKSRRSSSEEEEQKPRKRLDTADTPSPSDPEEGGGEEMASTSATSGTEETGSESSTSSADTTPSRSTSCVELESLANAGNAVATKSGSKDTSTAAGSAGAEAGRISPNVMSFAEAAASPRVSPTPRPRTSPRPSTSRTQTGPTATSTPEQAGAAPPTSVGPTKPKGYPPITVDIMPNWTSHFKTLKNKLGHAPSARPFGKGVRFMPASPEEFRVVQKYLVEATQADPQIQWFCYSVDSEKPTKVAIKGLPPDTDPEEIKMALEEWGHEVLYVKHIPGVGGRPGCLFHATLKHQSQEALSRLYSHTELLYMPGVVIEGWRGVSGVAQCHRCQRFGHSSNNCHRAPKCVRCAEEHLSSECPRPRQDKPTCANCGQAHAACYKRCPLYLKEVRKRRASVPPPPPRGRKVAEKRPPRPTRAERRRAQAPLPPETAHPQLAPTPADIPQERGGGATLAVQANDPTDRHAPLPQRKKRHRAGRKHRRRAPIAAQEAGPRSSHAQTPAPRANCAHCGQNMPPKAPVFVHRQPAQVAPESDGKQTGRNTRRQQRSELAARPVAPAQPKQQPWEFQPLPQRQPRSRTRRTATPAAPTTTTAGGIDARDPLQIILQRLDRMEMFCGALTELISTIAAGGDLKVAAIRILPRVTANP
ncbi:hypothetical protein K1T71_014554 [Dendrolimus kikuchii]|uniref:Uncharacterized protein n=1 Tax=Dendrolimus kikuchii TaxID=765133 RepID=A0ACC1CEK5_9NEOP|nr:hypothetical protein K1T71_014554 [Dendrolimus kikuchii]